MFEFFNVPSMALIPKSTLALYYSGKTTGLVLDSGYETTQVVPIYEGFPLTHAAKSMPVGGWHVTDYLIKLLNGRGYDFKSADDRDNLRRVKEKYCYCALNFKEELAAFETDKIQSHKLPDGTVVEIHTELLVLFWRRTIMIIRFWGNSCSFYSCLLGITDGYFECNM